MTPARPDPLDPFDLADSLGAGSVTWTATDGLATGHRVRGALVAAADPGTDTPCDLLAVDDAYPVPVADAGTRASAHQAWQHGQVHLAAYDARLTLLVPGTRLTPELALEALRRLALALGARPCDFSALLRLTD